MRYKSFLAERIGDLKRADVPKLDEKEWEAIPIAKLFDSFVNGKGKGRNHLNETLEAGTSYVGATNRNDGVLCFVKVDGETKSMVQPGNCIGFIRNGDGAAGYAVYKAEPFISTSDVVYGYASWLNRFTGLFFVAAQDKIKPKYSHGHKRSPARLMRDRVMLPVDVAGEPDFAYMEQYAMNLMLAKYEQYLAFLDRKGE